MEKLSKGIYQQIKDKGNISTFERNKFTYANLKEFFNNYNPIKSSYTIPCSIDTKNYVDLIFEVQNNPTEENKVKLAEEVKKINEKAQKVIDVNRLKFAEFYGQEMLDFIDGINNPKYTYWMGMNPFNFRWKVKWDEDSDDYWVIRFNKGKFKYSMESCSGYGSTDVLEADISKERVLELLNK